jgi:hypothetical protein
MRRFKWFVGAPRTLKFTIGPIGATDLVYLDYYIPSELTLGIPRSLPATIVDRTTGECRCSYTPEENGEYRFWPHLTDAAGVDKDILDFRRRIVDLPGY